jgi:hypothetical protein
MSGGCCPARGEDPALRLQCIREPHADDWHQDSPERWWITVPNNEEDL